MSLRLCPWCMSLSNTVLHKAGILQGAQVHQAVVVFVPLLLWRVQGLRDNVAVRNKAGAQVLGQCQQYFGTGACVPQQLTVPKSQRKALPVR